MFVKMTANGMEENKLRQYGPSPHSRQDYYTLECLDSIYK